MSRLPSQAAARYIRKRVNEQMAYRVQIYRNGTPNFDEASGVYTAKKATLVYEGRGRIWYAGGGSAIAIGEGDIVVTPTYLSIPFTADPVPRVDDVVVVIDSPDSDLLGRTLRITSVDSGSYIHPARKMQVVVWSDNRTWTSEA